MAIKHLINTRTPGELREFQSRMIMLGRIRTGVFETPPGRRGRPAKLDRFRFTSPDRDLITAVAAEYGGTVEEFVPQGVGKRGWQVTTDADRIPVYIVNGQKIDPTYEAWAGGGRCVRRCDGEWDTVRCRPCLCNGLDTDDQDGTPVPPPPVRDMCKPTTRVNLMLPAIEGIGSWLYESHGENFAIENGGVLAQFVASAPVAVPAWFCLEPEVRQARKPDGSGFERREFYVARFRITAITPEQIALGGDVVSRILTAAGAPAALSGAPRAIEAGPVSAVPTSAAPVAPVASVAPVAPVVTDAPPPVLRATGEPDWRGGARVDREEYNRILAAIEGAPTLARLDGIRDGLADRNVRAKPIQDAWVSKRRAIEAEANLNAVNEQFANDLDARLSGPCLDPWCANGPTPCGYTPDQHMQAHGAQALLDADRAAGRVPDGEPPFTDPGDPWAAEEFDRAGAQAVAEEAAELANLINGVEVAPDGLPVLPPGEYLTEVELPRLMATAGRLDPPWTTDEVRTAVVGAFQLNHIGDATGEQYARIRLGIEHGILT